MTATIHYLHARRRALHAVERQAHTLRLAGGTARPHPSHSPLCRPPSQPAPRRRQSPWGLVVFWVAWLAVIAVGMYLAAHDPYTPARAMSHLLGEVPA